MGGRVDVVCQKFAPGRRVVRQRAIRTGGRISFAFITDSAGEAARNASPMPIRTGSFTPSRSIAADSCVSGPRQRCSFARVTETTTATGVEASMPWASKEDWIAAAVRPPM